MKGKLGGEYGLGGGRIVCELMERVEVVFCRRSLCVHKIYAGWLASVEHFHFCIDVFLA